MTVSMSALSKLSTIIRPLCAGGTVGSVGGGGGGGEGGSAVVDRPRISMGACARSSGSGLAVDGVTGVNGTGVGAGAGAARGGGVAVGVTHPPASASSATTAVPRTVLLLRLRRRIGRGRRW